MLRQIFIITYKGTIILKFDINLNVGLSNRRIHDTALFAVHHLCLLGVEELGRVRRYRPEQLNVPSSMSVLQRCRGQMINVCNVKDGKQIPILNSLEMHVRCWMHILITRSHCVLPPRQN